MKRRTLLAGIGALASGSGAIATSAAIANSVQTTSQLSVVVDEQLKVRAGQAFNNDGSVKDEYTNQYVPYDSNISFFDSKEDVLDDIDQEELPVATVNRRRENINNEVKIQTAISVNMSSNTFRFENILEVENYGGTSKDISISYDRDKTEYGSNGQYGEDVNVGDTISESKLTAHDVRSIYDFQVPERFIDSSESPRKISPAYFNPDGDNDAPANSYVLSPGETIQIDLNIDFGEYSISRIDPREGVESAVDKASSFSGTVETVDLLDAISFREENSN